jgi:hypothetical protein
LLSDVEGVATADQAAFEQDLIQTHGEDKTPLIGKIRVHPADESDLRMVSSERLGRTKDGRYGWKQKRVMTRMPYVPALGGRTNKAEYPSVVEYLAEMKQAYAFIHYDSGWWLIPRNAAIGGGAVGMVIVGGIWPTLLFLMSGAGFGRRYNPKYKDDRSLWRVRPSKTTPVHRPQVTAEQMARVQAVADAYEQNLAPAGGHAHSASAAAATPSQEVRQLDARPLEEAKPLPNPDADDEVEVKGEYYPVMIHHKKHHEEGGGDPHSGSGTD